MKIEIKILKLMLKSINKRIKQQELILKWCRQQDLSIERGDTFLLIKLLKIKDKILDKLLESKGK